MTPVSDEGLQPAFPLTAEQRRVLGVLIEKSLTTPAAYPLTLNATVSGCNQKSNRSPAVDYDTTDVEVALDELRKLDLVNVVITSGGHVERYRQLARIVFGWSDQHVAIMGELLLRGRQQLGELRSRASRMKAIDSLDQLRERLDELRQAGHVSASGSLERRGVEVDHRLYEESGVGMSDAAPAESPARENADTPSPNSTAATPAAPTSAVQSQPAELDAIRETVAALQQRVGELEETVESLEQKLDGLI